MAKTAWLIV